MGRLRNLAWRVRYIFRFDAVLVVACVLAALSCIAVPPDVQYASYIDWRTLGLLFSLMVATSGLARAQVLSRMCHALVGMCKSGGALVSALVALAFFASMVVTNDVALVAFVPLAIAALREAGLVGRLPFAIACMTVAANMGSMLTPIGNPQNIYLQSASGMAPCDLVCIMAPYSVLAFLLLALAIGVAELRGRKRCAPASLQARGLAHAKPQSPLSMRDVAPWAALIVVCLLCVARIVPVGVAVVAALVAALGFDRRALRQVDYALLLTFVAFFVFVGNVARIETVQHAIASIVDGHVLLVGALASQLISNVPAAIMLSGFTSDWPALLVGVNIGGLGTLVASMASLISYRQLAVAYPKAKGRYLLLFTGINLAFLVAMLALSLVIA